MAQIKNRIRISGGGIEIYGSHAFTDSEATVALDCDGLKYIRLPLFTGINCTVAPGINVAETLVTTNGTIKVRDDGTVIVDRADTTDSGLKFFYAIRGGGM